MVLSHYEDYFEGQGHGIYLLDGKIRLHVIFRSTDIGMRVETVEPVKLHEWQHVLVTYDGLRKASGVRIYVDGQSQKLKVLFDELNWPMKFKAPFRIAAGGGMHFEGSINDVRVYNIALSPEQAATVPLHETDPRNRGDAGGGPQAGATGQTAFLFPGTRCASRCAARASRS